jgi:hypothetical protein
MLIQFSGGARRAKVCWDPDRLWANMVPGYFCREMVTWIQGELCGVLP